MKTENNFHCWLIVLGFGLVSFIYAFKVAVTDENYIGSGLYCLIGIVCATLVRWNSKTLSHVQLSLVLIAFFWVSVINGNLAKVAMVVVFISMLYLLVEIISKKGAKAEKKDL